MLLFDNKDNARSYIFNDIQQRSIQIFQGSPIEPGFEIIMDNPLTPYEVIFKAFGQIMCSYHMKSDDNQQFQLIIKDSGHH